VLTHRVGVNVVRRKVSDVLRVILTVLEKFGLASPPPPPHPKNGRETKKLLSTRKPQGRKNDKMRAKRVVEHESKIRFPVTINANNSRRENKTRVGSQMKVHQAASGNYAH